MRLLALAALSLAAPAVASPVQDLRDLHPLLAKAIRAAGQLRYSGTRVVEYRVGANRNRHEEHILRDRDRTRIAFPEGSPQEGQVIVENAKLRKHYFPPPQNEIWILPSRHRDSIARLARLLSGAKKRGLAVRVGRGGRVAGYATEEAAVVDRNGNVVTKLWIEPRTGCILRRESYDRVGASVGASQFTSINFRPRFGPGDFEIVRRGATEITPRMMAARLARENGLRPIGLDGYAGFDLEHSRIVKREGKTALVQFYAGPKGRFSLFQAKEPLSRDHFRRSARGVYRVITWHRNGESFAIVGDPDEATMREIAKKLGG